MKHILNGIDSLCGISMSKKSKKKKERDFAEMSIKLVRINHIRKANKKGQLGISKDCSAKLIAISKIWLSGLSYCKA